MRRLRGDIFSALTTIKSLTIFIDTYERNKRKAILTGVIAATYVVTFLGRYAPRLALKLHRMIKKRERKVGRGVEVPKQQEGSIQEYVEKENKEVVQRETTLSRRKVNKLESQSRDGRFFNRFSKGKTVIEGNALRILGQVVEACKEYNKQDGGMKVKYELSNTEQGELLVSLEGKTLRVNEYGIYSMVGNPYYVHDEMDKNTGLNRLMLDHTIKSINLMVSMLLVYEGNLFDVDEPDDIFKKNKIDKQKKKEDDDVYRHFHFVKDEDVEVEDKKDTTNI